MSRTVSIDGRTFVQRGRRWYVVPKDLCTTDRVHAQTSVRGNWNAVDSTSRNLRPRVIVNQR